MDVGGIKPFWKMNISHTLKVIHLEHIEWMALPENDPLLPLKLFREGKTTKEVGKDYRMWSIDIQLYFQYQKKDISGVPIVLKNYL